MATEIKISIRTLSGKTVDIEVNSGATVGQLKQAIEHNGETVSKLHHHQN
jgi:hypothetical protein